MSEESDNKSKSSVGWSTVIAGVVSLFNYIFKILYSRTGNSDLNKGEKNRKLQEILDKNKEKIKESHKTDNLDEIRKMIGK